MSLSAVIRSATDSDVAAITRIYGHHVLHGLASFEYDPPDEGDMLARMITLREGGYPYMVAERDGVIVGYSYAGPYRARPGYQNSVEDAVYMDPDAQGRGIAKALLQSVIDSCTDLGFRQMIAVIGDASAPSVGLHMSLGFEIVGTLHGIGFKSGQWVDTVHMQRSLGDGEGTLPTR
jgi:L-amino acid N-acyltransferase YncA